ncbi:MAG: hypothetical protein FJY82_14405 [Candidatus Aminicenantes bacterium]|nr:hypothetical protein [Candidatus Aminicenantes bacterium]
MIENSRESTKSRTLLRWLFAAAFVFAIIMSGAFAGLMNKAGLLYLVFGSVAAALMGFTGREIATAFKMAGGAAGTEESLRVSAHFWEAAARNAWILGAMGSALNFTIALGTPSEGIAGISNRMIQSFIVTLYGLVLAVVCLVPAMKLSGQAGKVGRPASVASGGLPLDRIVGHVLFAAVLVLTVLFMIGGQPQGGPMPIAKVLLHGPAILVVIGGSIALALFMGAGAGARAWTLGFAMTGLVSLLTGLIQALLGFVHRNIAEIASACAFIISASTFALLGLVAVAGPLEDREVAEGRRDGPGILSRLSWVLFPLLTFIFLLLTFLMVVTPMEKPGPGM